MAVMKFNQEMRFKNLARGDVALLDDRGLSTFPTHFKLEEFFQQRPALNAVKDYGTPTNAQIIAGDIANNDFEVLGTNMTTALCTFAVDGGVTLTTAGADNDQGIIAPHLNTNQTAWANVEWGTGKQTCFEALIKTGASIADVTIWAGLKLTNTSVVATDDNQVFFRYAASGGTDFKLVNSRANVDVSSDTGIALAASTLYRLRIELDAGRRVNAYINGVQVANNLAALTDAVNLIPYIGVHANTGSPKAITAKYLGCSRQAA